MRSGERGFTYLLLLLGLALAAAASAALGEQWVAAAQRERELELLFRGKEIAQALAGWQAATPDGQPVTPQSLQELLVDRRGPQARHHLRRLYVDPFTLEADWDLLRDSTGRVQAVASRSRVAAMSRPPLKLRQGADPHRPRVGDWVFEPAPDAAPSSTPGPANPRIGDPRRP